MYVLHLLARFDQGCGIYDSVDIIHNVVFCYLFVKVSFIVVRFHGMHFNARQSGNRAFHVRNTKYLKQQQRLQHQEGKYI